MKIFLKSRYLARALGGAGLLAGCAVAVAAPALLSAEQIVARNIAARGGAVAWHGVQSMALSGTMEAGTGDSLARSMRYAHLAMAPRKRSDLAAAGSDDAGAAAEKQVQLPFVIDMKRPGLARVEIEFAGKTALQIYDGKNGWKLRPFLNRDAVEPFSAEELKASTGKWDIDGPLLGYEAKGTKLRLEGVEALEGRDAYRLALTLKSGDIQHVWIDAQSFLDVKVEGTPRRLDGKVRKVYVAQRDFRSVQGLTLPFLLETSVEGYRETHKMALEKVTLNPVLGDSLFAKPTPGGI